MADEEALRKIRSVEEQIDILNKKLSIAKQVCAPPLIVPHPTCSAFTLSSHIHQCRPPSAGGGRAAE